MGLKILHTADWHLGSPLNRFSEEQREELTRALGSVPDLLGDLIAREGCDMALLAGDIFDGAPARHLADAVKDALRAWKIPVFIAPGNHDPAPCWQEDWPENVHIFRGGLESVSVPGLNCRVWGAGYQNMDCPALLEGFRASGPERYQIGILHGDPLNANSPCCPVTAQQVEKSGLTYLALGHIHAAGQLRRGETLCGWPGCPMGRGWDETGEKGVYLARLEETAAITWVPLDLPRFVDEAVEIDEDPLASIRRRLGSAGDHYRLTLEGEGNVDQEALYAALREYPNLILRDKTTAPRDLWENAGEDTLEGALFGRLYAAAQTAQGRDLEQVRLAAKICRALLEGREVKL